MKIIQTLWSGGQDLTKDKFGWESPHHHLMAWTLSCLKLTSYYSKIELYTDTHGYEILINRLKLPYTKVHVVMNEMDLFKKELWALSKLKTYSLQEEPFLHVDSDVFIWSKFNSDLLSSSLIAQNFETATSYYRTKFRATNGYLQYLPESIDLTVSDGQICSCNAGIIGGTDITFFKKYTRLAFDIIKYNNLNELPPELLLDLNVLIEQILFYRLAMIEDERIVCYFDQIYDDNGYEFKDFADFSATPHSCKYLHLIGPHKRNKTTCDLMARTLLVEYPHYFFEALALFPDARKFSFSSYPLGLKRFPAGNSKHHYNYQTSPSQTILSSNKNIKSDPVIEIKKSPANIILKSDSPTLCIFQHTRIQYYNLRETRIYLATLLSILLEFRKIPREELIKRDVYSVKGLSFFINQKETQLEAILQKQPFLRTIKINSDKPSCFLKQLGFETIAEGIDELYYEIAYVPEFFISEYNSISFDYLDHLIVDNLLTECSLRELLNKIGPHFEIDTANAISPEFFNLILMKLKRLVQYKCVNVILF